MKTLKNLTLVTFILCGDTVSKYFEGNPTIEQINGITGMCEIQEIQRVKSNIYPDYIRTKNIFGYTAS